MIKLLKELRNRIAELEQSNKRLEAETRNMKIQIDLLESCRLSHDRRLDTHSERLDTHFDLWKLGDSQRSRIESEIRSLYKINQFSES